MTHIGGNTEFTIQKLSTQHNAIGEDEKSWSDTYTGNCFLDMITEDSNQTYNLKITQSTHVLLCDYFDYKALKIKAENHRVIIDGEIYDIKFIDDVMNMHEQIEIYLRYFGGVDND